MDFLMLCIIGITLLFIEKDFREYNYLLIVIIGLLFTCATSTMDSFAYENSFNMIVNNASFDSIIQMGYGIDLGFLFCMKLVSIFTNNYLIFRLCIFCISICFIILAIRKIDKKFSNSLIMYFLFPMLYDTFQIEFFLAYSIITYGLAILVKSEKYCILKYIILVVVASFIHESVIVFLVFVFVKNNNGKFFKKIILCWIIGFTVLNIFLRVNIVKSITNVLPVLGNFVGNYANGNVLNILTIIMSCTLFIFLLYYSFCIKNNSEDSNMLFLINCWSMIFLPMIFTSLDFERLFRPIQIIDYAYIINSASFKDKKLKTLEIIIIGMLLFRFWVLFDYYISNYNDVINVL